MAQAKPDLDVPLKLLRPRPAAKRLTVNPRLVIDKRWRERVGLATYRIGGELRFSEADIKDFLARAREVPRGAA